MNHILVVLAVAVSLIAEQACGAESSLQDKLNQRLSDSALPLHYVDRQFSGPAWAQLVSDAQKAQFLLIGEEHGIAENPLLVQQLFDTLADHAYRHLIIEVSPQAAMLMENQIAQSGLDGLRALFAQPGGEPAFFGMAQEAQMLAAVKQRLLDQPGVLLGVDYEVAADRPLLQWLKQQPKPESAIAPVEALIQASQQAWQAYAEEKNPGRTFSFSGNPQLVRNVGNQWPDPDPGVQWLLEVLEKTLVINQQWQQGLGWQSNQLRAELIKHNFIRHWRILRAEKALPKMIAKLGASHLIRGRNSNDAFDLGTLLPEIAQLHGQRSISVLVLPGENAEVAVLDPVHWRYQPAPPKDGYTEGLTLLYAHAKTGMTLLPMKPIRPLLRGAFANKHARLTGTAYGFDYVLIMTGSTPSGELQHTNRTPGDVATTPLMY